MDLNPTAASVLGFLHHEPMSGSEVMRRVQRSIGYFWNVTRSQVYRELGTLEQEKLIRPAETGARERVRYAITQEGKDAFAEWIKLEPAPELSRHEFLLKTFFGAQLPPARLREFIAGHRVRHEARLAEYQQLWSEPVPDDFRREVLRFGIEYEKMVLRWIDALPFPGSREKKPRRAK